MEGFRGVLKAARTAMGFVGLAMVAAAVVVLGGCGSSSSSKQSASLTGSGYPGVDAANTRHVGGPIDSSSVSSLAEAWSAPIKGTSSFGSYASTPVIDKGVIYSQDLGSNVEAIDLESGEVLWSKTFEQPDEGPN